MSVPIGKVSKGVSSTRRTWKDLAGCSKEGIQPCEKNRESIQNLYLWACERKRLNGSGGGNDRENSLRRV